MAPLRRILAVTAGLLALGATAGALAGALAAMLAGATSFRTLSWYDLDLLFLGAAIGAPLGAILLPVAGWLLMRHVPLGRALLGTMAGTVIGGFVGWWLPTNHLATSGNLDWSIGLGFAGFAIAVVYLRVVSARSMPKI